MAINPENNTYDPMAVVDRMRSLDIPDHVIEDLIGVKPPAVVDDDDDAEPVMEAPEDDEEVITVET